MTIWEFLIAFSLGSILTSVASLGGHIAGRWAGSRAHDAGEAAASLAVLREQTNRIAEQTERIRNLAREPELITFEAKPGDDRPA